LYAKSAGQFVAQEKSKKIGQTAGGSFCVFEFGEGKSNVVFP